MKESKQFNHMPVSTSLISQHQAVGPNASPVRDAVVAPPVDLELVAQLLKEIAAVVDAQVQLLKIKTQYCSCEGSLLEPVPLDNMCTSIYQGRAMDRLAQQFIDYSNTLCLSKF